jgi:hypothetical protein
MRPEKVRNFETHLFFYKDNKNYLADFLAQLAYIYLKMLF